MNQKDRPDPGIELSLRIAAQLGINCRCGGIPHLGDFLVLLAL